VPAKALGLGHRVGSLKPGYDADVVIWDRNPLSLGAAPLQVFVDGIAQFDKREITPVETEEHKKAVQQPLRTQQKEATTNSKTFVLTNVGKIVLKQKQATQGKIVVDNGRIVCAGDECDAQVSALGQNINEIDVNGGYVIPASIICITNGCSLCIPI
jgi:imidazolonepropionase-like amidohydrolase